MLIDWNPVNESVIPELSPEVAFPIYAVAKTITERRLWKFVDEHPDFDVTTSSYCFSVFYASFALF
jgi:hypothetical protein